MESNRPKCWPLPVSIAVQSCCPKELWSLHTAHATGLGHVAAYVYFVFLSQHETTPGDIESRAFAELTPTYSIWGFHTQKKDMQQLYNVNWWLLPAIWLPRFEICNGWLCWQKIEGSNLTSEKRAESRSTKTPSDWLRRNTTKYKGTRWHNLYLCLHQWPLFHEEDHTSHGAKAEPCISNNNNAAKSRSLWCCECSGLVVADKVIKFARHVQTRELRSMTICRESAKISLWLMQYTTTPQGYKDFSLC